MKMTNTLRDDAERLADKIYPRYEKGAYAIVGKDIATSLVIDALAAAFNAGAEKMRKQATDVCNNKWNEYNKAEDNFKDKKFPASIARFGAAECAIAIRSLPLPDYEVKK